MIRHAEVLCPGEAAGDVLRFDAPISFWGGVSPETSAVTLAGHPQEGCLIADRILVLPQLIGSSSSSAVLLELIHKQRAPRGLILGERDAILPIGVVVAHQMGWPTIPVFLMPTPPFQTGGRLVLHADGRVQSAET